MMFESCRSHITIGGSKGAAVHWTLWPNSLCWDHSDVIGGKRRNAGFWVIQDVIMSIFPRTFVDLFWQNEAVTWVFLLFFWLYHAGKKLFTSPRGLGILATYLQVGSVFGEQFLGPWSWIHKTKKGVAICFLSGVCVCVFVPWVFSLPWLVLFRKQKLEPLFSYASTNSIQFPMWIACWIWDISYHGAGWCRSLGSHTRADFIIAFTEGSL